MTEENKPFYIVGIGASAGGLEALEQFFRYMPTETGMAFVVIQHLSPNFQSLMSELLARHTSMEIFQVADGMEVEPNTIYLIPPRKNLTLESKKLRLTDQVREARGVNFPINIFFDSLAKEKGEEAIGVVLSGTGSDGTLGIEAINKANGLVLVQAPETAGFDGMPVSAIGTHKVDFIAPADQLPGTLLEYQLDRDRVKGANENSSVHEENELSIVFALMRKRFEVDFSFYKMATVLRRIQRRVTFAKADNLADYVKRLRHDDEELDLLYRDLLVEVTEFFRDTDAFELLANEVIPEIVDNNPPDGEIRVWVPGCATGEEAYSMAMLFDNYCEQYRPNTVVKVFATDIHQQSVEIASSGVYDASRVEHLPEDYRLKYFSEMEDGRFVVTKTIRKMIVFSPHNLTQDPPFSRLNLISCRNVLIYFRQSTQQKVLNFFHFGLVNNGYLMLGPSEHTGELTDEFDMTDRRWRIFRKRRDVRLPNRPNILQRRSLSDNSTQILSPKPAYDASVRLTQMNTWQEMVLERYAPPSLLVNQRYELQHVFGEAGQYLRSMHGRTTLDATRLVIPILHTALRAALHRASRENELVSYKGVRISVENDPAEYVQLTVEPFISPRDKDRFFLISIHPLETPEETPERPLYDGEPFVATEATVEQISLLERELQHTKEHLQSTVEELETTNEELQSTNEELVASNEELQSTNEELHSVNEELYTVNSEYQSKITELVQATNDVKNLERSARISVIYLDLNGRIRDFSPHASELFNLLPQDVGRPIDHLLYTLNMRSEVLNFITKSVLESGESIEHEVRLPSGKYYILRALPYETEAGLVEGVVLTLNNVTELKRIEKSIHQNRKFSDLLLKIILYRAASTRDHLRYALTQATQILRMERGGVSEVKDDVLTVLVGYDPTGQLKEGSQFPREDTLVDIIMQEGDIATIEQMSKSKYAEHPAYSTFGRDAFIGAITVPYGDEANSYCGTLTFTRDGANEQPFSFEEQEFVRSLNLWVGTVLRQLKVEDVLSDHLQTSTDILNQVSNSIVSLNLAREFVFVNKAFTEQFGYSSEEVKGLNTRLLYRHQNDFDAIRSVPTPTETSKLMTPEPVELLCKDGSSRFKTIIASPIISELDEVLGYFAFFHDAEPTTQTLITKNGHQETA